MYLLFCTLCKMIVHNRSHDNRLCYHTPRNFVVYFGNFFLLFYSTELYGYGVRTQSLSNKFYLVHKIIPLINNLLIFYKRFYLPFVRKKSFSSLGCTINDQSYRFLIFCKVGSCLAYDFVG